MATRPHASRLSDDIGSLAGALDYWHSDEEETTAAFEPHSLEHHSCDEYGGSYETVVDAWYSAGPGRHCVGTIDERLALLLTRTLSGQASSAIADADALAAFVRAELDRRIEVLRQNLLTEIAEKIAAQTPEPAAVEDAVDVWIRNHQELLAGYKGKRVAIHPTLGIVASDPDLIEVHKKVEALGLVNEVVFDAIPET